MTLVHGVASSSADVVLVWSTSTRVGRHQPLRPQYTQRFLKTCHQIFTHDCIVLNDHVPVRRGVVTLPRSTAVRPPLSRVLGWYVHGVIDDLHTTVETRLNPLRLLLPNRVSHDLG